MKKNLVIIIEITLYRVHVITINNTINKQLINLWIDPLFESIYRSYID